MKNSSKLFIGNWKMFGIPSSIKILDKINDFFKKDKNNNRKNTNNNCSTSYGIKGVFKNFKNKKF